MSIETATHQQLPAVTDAASRLAEPKLQPGHGSGLTAKVRVAIDLMVFHGNKRKGAAKDAGLTDEAMRQALLKPQVLKHLHEQQEVLRASLRPRALHRIGELADKSGSEKVGLDAAKYLDSQGKSDQPRVNVGVQLNVAPGYIVDVTGQTEQAEQIAQQAGSSANCLQSNDDVLTDD